MNDTKEDEFPSKQVGEGNRAAVKTLIWDGLDDVGREIVRNFIAGRPYREPSAIQSEIAAQKSK